MSEVEALRQKVEATLELVVEKCDRLVEKIQNLRAESKDANMRILANSLLSVVNSFRVNALLIKGNLKFRGTRMLVNELQVLEKSADNLNRILDAINKAVDEIR